MARKDIEPTFHYRWQGLSDGLNRLIKAYQFLLTKGQEDEARPGFANKDEEGTCREEEKLKSKENLQGRK